MERDNDTAELSLENIRRKRVIEEGFEILRDQFVDDSSIGWDMIHRRLQRRIERMESDEHMEEILDWMYSRVDDPFTRYLPHRQLEAMKGDIDGQMCGVGIVFNAERHGWFMEEKRVVIKHVVPGSPADEAGLQSGDQITAIDMVDVSNMSFDEATTRLLGKAGRKVLLTFLREKRRIGVERVTRTSSFPSTHCERGACRKQHMLHPNPRIRNEYSEANARVFISSNERKTTAIESNSNNGRLWNQRWRTDGIERT